VSDAKPGSSYFSTRISSNWSTKYSKLSDSSGIELLAAASELLQNALIIKMYEI
jgi:hypothetical protein